MLELAKCGVDTALVEPYPSTRPRLDAPDQLQTMSRVIEDLQESDPGVERHVHGRSIFSNTVKSQHSVVGR